MSVEDLRAGATIAVTCCPTLDLDFMLWYQHTRIKLGLTGFGPREP